MDILNSVMSNESTISLRVIDWFVNNFAKTHNVTYLLHGEIFSPYNNFILESNSNPDITPFKRGVGFRIDNTSNKYTLGQLHFFRWAIEKNVITYISEHIDEIKNDMNIDEH